MYKVEMSCSTMVFVVVTLMVSCVMAASAAPCNFNKEIDINWGGNEHVKIFNGGKLLTLSLDNSSGAAFQTKNDYLFARVDMQLKLVPGNSAGTVATYYLSSLGAAHDEIDFEFLGNLSGQPYTVHTNVYSQGKGNREQQFRMWFDPTLAFHTYSVIWNSQRIIFMVDNIPIRVFENNEAIGVPFPNSQRMKVYASLWDADNWATEGGRIKTDWTQAPFIASYKNLKINASSPANSTNNTISNQAWQTQQLDSMGRKKLRWVQSKCMIYNYCTDFQRFPQGLPPECLASS
ncbi:hypothetical protein LOK49_LG07G01837 [Camellia lanceoleosa]|uniref:Uncharacterized protein n=1 Tax=Camellia lanceoleosa TaxID=1840588 RepID=A0ACC0H4S3_9ERIC|nr:hypothetical protein LOK49_LG07G01837 [Camellia lanceoleosa]